MGWEPGGDLSSTFLFSWLVFMLFCTSWARHLVSVSPLAQGSPPSAGPVEDTSWSCCRLLYPVSLQWTTRSTGLGPAQLS